MAWIGRWHSSKHSNATSQPEPGYVEPEADTIRFHYKINTVMTQVMSFVENNLLLMPTLMYNEKGNHNTYSQEKAIKQHQYHKI